MSKGVESEFKNIIVVGGSFAGHSVANNLAPTLPPNYRILLIERTPFALHVPGVVRGVCLPGSEGKNLMAPVRQETIFKAGSRHRVLCPAEVIELRRDSVVIDVKFEDETELFFDKCIIATGADQPDPLRPLAGQTMEDYRATLRGYQKDFAKANNILVVGGGAVGVEITGELTAHYTDKQVTLVHGHEHILQTASWGEPTKPNEYHYSPSPLYVSLDLEAQLRNRGVHLALSDRVVFPDGTQPVSSDKSSPPPWNGQVGALPFPMVVTLRSGTTVLADYVFMSTGNRPASSLVSIDPGALVNGYVAVDLSFRIQTTSTDSVFTNNTNYFALGDVASSPGRKTAGQANAEGKVVARIVGKQLKRHDGLATGRRNWRVEGIFVPLGYGGVGVGSGAIWKGWFCVHSPKWLISLSAKNYFASNFFARFKGQRRVGYDGVVV